jgi:hypothetical protein
MSTRWALEGGRCAPPSALEAVCDALTRCTPCSRRRGLLRRVGAKSLPEKRHGRPRTRPRLPECG